MVDEVIERMGGQGLKVTGVAFSTCFFLRQVISCHLGAGCSIAASEGGLSKDTSMGFSPGEGLMMGVRAGDFDSSIVPYMAARLGVGEKEILRRCGEESGFLGLAGSPDSKYQRCFTKSLVIGFLGVDFCHPGNLRTDMKEVMQWQL